MTKSEIICLIAHTNVEARKSQTSHHRHKITRISGDEIEHFEQLTRAQILTEILNHCTETLPQDPNEKLFEVIHRALNLHYIESLADEGFGKPCAEHIKITTNLKAVASSLGIHYRTPQNTHSTMRVTT